MLSFAVHGLLLSLTFGGQALGLASFGVPVPDPLTDSSGPSELRVVLLPAPLQSPSPTPAPNPAPNPPVKPAQSAGKPETAALVQRGIGGPTTSK